MMSRDIIFSDFDGTLTNIAGGNLVFTPQYESAVTNMRLAQEQAEILNPLTTILTTIDELSKTQTSLMDEMDALTSRYEDEITAHNKRANRSDSDSETTMEHPPTEGVKLYLDKRTQLDDISQQLEENEEMAKGMQSAASFYTLMSNVGQNISPPELIAQNMQANHHEAYEMAKGAANFMQLMLQKPDADFIIVSKNHQEYIQAVLLHAGFTNEQLNRITIIDVRHGGGHKEKAVMEKLAEYKERNISINSISVLDDSGYDYKAMMRGVRKSSIEIAADKVQGHNAEPGEFNYTKIMETSDQIMKPSVEEIIAEQKPSLASSVRFFAEVPTIDTPVTTPDKTPDSTPRPGTGRGGQD